MAAVIAVGIGQVTADFAPVLCQNRIGRNHVRVSDLADAPWSQRKSSSALESPMMSVAPLQFLLLVFAGWVNRRQVEVIEYLQEENHVLSLPRSCANASAAS